MSSVLVLIHSPRFDEIFFFFITRLFTLQMKNKFLVEAKQNILNNNKNLLLSVFPRDRKEKIISPDFCLSQSQACFHWVQ
jgi:hypothetical protein